MQKKRAKTPNHKSMLIKEIAEGYTLKKENNLRRKIWGTKINDEETGTHVSYTAQTFHLCYKMLTFVGI